MGLPRAGGTHIPSAPSDSQASKVLLAPQASERPPGQQPALPAGRVPSPATGRASLFRPQACSAQPCACTLTLPTPKRECGTWGRVPGPSPGRECWRAPEGIGACVLPRPLPVSPSPHLLPQSPPLVLLRLPVRGSPWAPSRGEAGLRWGLRSHCSAAPVSPAQAPGAAWPRAIEAWWPG